MTQPIRPTSTIPGNPSWSLFNRVERATTGNPEFNTLVYRIAHYIGYVYDDEEIVPQPGETALTVAPELAGDTITKFRNIIGELEESLKQQNLQGQSGIPTSTQDTRTINQTTGLITLGRELLPGETFNTFNGIVVRKKTTTRRNPEPNTKSTPDYAYELIEK